MPARRSQRAAAARWAKKGPPKPAAPPPKPVVVRVADAEAITCPMCAQCFPDLATFSKHFNPRTGRKCFDERGWQRGTHACTWTHMHLKSITVLMFSYAATSVAPLQALCAANCSVMLQPMCWSGTSMNAWTSSKALGVCLVGAPQTKQVCLPMSTHHEPSTQLCSWSYSRSKVDQWHGGSLAQRRLPSGRAQAS